MMSKPFLTRQSLFNFTWIAFIFLSMIRLDAVPSFARNLGLDCSACHTVYPQLTEFGKVFLETGGDILIQKQYGAMTMTPQVVSGHIALLPIDKKFSSDSTTKLTREEKQLKLRAFNELNAYLAGRVENVFFFTVFSAEDDDDFDLGFEEGFAMLNMFENNLNIFMGYDSPYITDGNNTVQHDNVLTRQWKAAEYTPDTSQMLGLNGLNGDFYWIATWNGGEGVSEGNAPKGVSLRAAYTFHSQTFGAYYTRNYLYDDECSVSKNPYTFYGLDGHLRFKNTNILMLLGFRKLHDLKSDWDFSIEWNSIFNITNPCLSKYLYSIVPIANIDVFVDRTMSSGLWCQGSGGIIFYLNPSVRFFPQVAGTLHAPSGYKHRELSFYFALDIGL